MIHIWLIFEYHAIKMGIMYSFDRITFPTRVCGIDVQGDVWCISLAEESVEQKLPPLGF